MSISEPLSGTARVAASAFVYLTYRSVEVRRPEVDLSRRPVIIVANHSAGFADPIVIMHALDRRSHFLAKATFWSNPIVGWVFDVFGVLPIGRASDGDTDGNVKTFDACHDVLRDGEIVAVFPEGEINHAPEIRDIHTGTARIALGARASGAAGVTIVPVGIHYEERTRLRSRIYAKVGEPIDIDADIGIYVTLGESEDDSNHRAVQLLTAEIERRLRSVAPDFTSHAEWDTLSTAADVALRSRLYDPSVEVSYGDREEFARRLRHSAPDSRATVLEATAGYEEILASEGTNDITVASTSLTGGALPDHAVRSVAGAVALAPTAAVGLAVNALPLAAMTLLRRNLKVNPLVKSTVRTIAAPILYGGTWTLSGVLLRRRGVRFGGTRAWAAGAVGGLALILASERIEDVRRGLAGQIGGRDGGPSDGVKAARQALLDAVEHAME